MNSHVENRQRLEEALRAVTEDGHDIVGHFGSVITAAGGRSNWWSIRFDEAVSKLRTNPDYKVAQILSVLGSEVRLAILRHLLQAHLENAPKTVAEIVAEVGLKTTGQAYHHLRELERAGYVEQRAGGLYHFSMNVGRVYLTALALAADAGAERPDEESATAVV